MKKGQKEKRLERVIRQTSIKLSYCVYVYGVSKKRNRLKFVFENYALMTLRLCEKQIGNESSFMDAFESFQQN